MVSIEHRAAANLIKQGLAEAVENPDEEKKESEKEEIKNTVEETK